MVQSIFTDLDFFSSLMPNFDPNKMEFSLSLAEITGYLGSAVVLTSFLMRNMRTLRIVNTIGCGLFVLYGIFLEYSWPIIITNVSIIAINLYFLSKKK